MRYETIEAAFTCLHLVVAGECREDMEECVSFTQDFPSVTPFSSCTALKNETFGCIQMWNDFVHNYKEIADVVPAFETTLGSVYLKICETMA
jgi:hypothetical protein